MPAAKVSHDVVEAVHTFTAPAKASQLTVEAVQAAGTYPTEVAETSIPLSIPGESWMTFIGSSVMVNKLGEVDLLTAQTVTIHVTTAFSASQNLGFWNMRTGANLFYNAPINTGDYTFAVTTANTGYWYVYSYNNNQYRPGMTGAATIDYTGLPAPDGARVSQAVVEVLMTMPTSPIRVSNDVIEVLISENAPSSTTTPTRTFGYAT